MKQWVRVPPVHFCLALVAALFLFAAPVNASPNVLSYQGRIIQSDNVPLESASTIFEFTIKSSSGCEIYRETSANVDMTGSGGLFDVAIGSGTKNYPTSAFKILEAFKNGTTFACENGGNYSAVDGDARLLHVRFFDGVTWKTIAPDNQIRSVPYSAYSNVAKEAQKLGTNVADDFVLKSSVPICGAGTYLRHIAPLGTFQCSALSVSGADVTGNITGSSAGFTGLLVGDVSGTQGATVVDKIKNIPVNLTGLTSGQILKYNGTAWIAANDDSSGSSGITSLTGDVTTTGTGAAAATIADGAVTSAKILDGTIVNADINASAAIADSKLATISTAGKVSGSAITSGTIGGSTSINTSGLIQTSSSVRFYSDSNKYTEVRSPAALADDLVFQFPGNAGTSGQVLTTNGSGVLSWTTISAGGGGTVTAVTASQPLTATTGATPNITITQANAATDGYVSSTDWNAFNAKLGVTTDLEGDVTGKYNSVSVNKIKSKEVVPVAYATGQVLRYDGTNWVNAVLGLSDTTGTLALNRGGTGATSAGGARTALELGTAATKNTGAVAGDIPVLGAAGLVGNGFCTADSAGTGIICNTSAPSGSQWTTSAPNIYYDSGSVGIGTTSPTAKLQVNGATLVGPGTPSYTGTSEFLSLRSTGNTPSLLFDNGLSSLARLSWNSNRFNFGKCSNADCSSSSPYFEIDTTNQITTFSNMNSIRAGNGSGNATTPTYSFSTSNNTGIFSPASNVLSFSTNSSERIRITSAGDVGIGTTSPDAKLDVNGGVKVGADATCTVAKSGTIAYNSSNIEFCVAGTWVALGSGGGSGGDFKSDGTVSMTAAMKGFAGLAATPGYSFSSAANYGMFYASNKLGFTAAGAERMTIASNGNVGVGITSPAASLHVSAETAISSANTTANSSPTLTLIKINGSSYASQSPLATNHTLGSIRFGGSNTSVAGEFTGNAAGIDVVAEATFSPSSQPTTMAFSTTAANSTTLSPRMYILSNGNVGIGVSNPDKKLNVAGDVKVTGSVEANGNTLTSDLRYKRNIASVESSLQKILNIRGVTYDWRTDEFPEKEFTTDKQLGVIAQEVETQFPEAVHTDKNGYKSVSYTSLVAPLIEAVKELFVSKADVQRVEKLELENQEMKQALCELGKKAFCKK